MMGLVDKALRRAALTTTRLERDAALVRRATLSVKSIGEHDRANDKRVEAFSFRKQLSA